jgi:hypothetical protein
MTTKIQHKQDKQVIYNFVNMKIHRKHHYHHSICSILKTVSAATRSQKVAKKDSLMTINETWALPKLPIVYIHQENTRKHGGHP